MNDPKLPCPGSPNEDAGFPPVPRVAKDAKHEDEEANDCEIDFREEGGGD